jgi:hypothetical protein
MFYTNGMHVPFITGFNQYGLSFFRYPKMGSLLKLHVDHYPRSPVPVISFPGMESSHSKPGDSEDPSTTRE